MPGRSPSRRCRISEASATAQSPASSAARSSSVSGAGAADPGGRHVGHTVPLAARLNARCGPSAPQRAQSWKLGAQPAMASAQQVGVEDQAGVMRALGHRAQRTGEQEVLLQRRFAPSVSRSAVSSIAVAAV